ncbi:hypothetical protein EDD15DRAFT_2202502 [Pisolithus albus]|nr:hypothetical protein EDD15DRAFT_2202502 [Pisolithus albus]
MPYRDRGIIVDVHRTRIYNPDAVNAWEYFAKAQRHIRVFHNALLTHAAATAYPTHLSPIERRIQPPTTMSVQKSPELQKSVERILQIFDRCVVSTMNLTEAERLKCWKEAVKAITGELDSVRPIINMTDSIPHLLIGVDKFLHWSERIGSPTHPFPDWKNVLFPTADLIAGHPWLLAVDRRSNNDRRDLSLHHGTSSSAERGQTGTSSRKGKQKEGDGEVPVTADHPIIPTLDDEGESEVHEVDELVDDNDDEVKPARGRSKKRARSQSTTRRSDTRGRSRSRMQTADVEEERDDRIGRSGRSTRGRPDAATGSKYGRAQFSARTTPPANPDSCGTCISRKVVCTRSADSGACDPCKARKIGCTQASRRRAPSTTRRSKTAATTNTPARRNPSRARKIPRRRDESPGTEGEPEDEPPATKKRRTSVAIDGTPRPSGSSAAKPKNQPFGKVHTVVIPTPKRTSSYAIPPARRAEPSGSTPVRAVSAEHQSRPMPPSAPTPEWIPPTATPSVPELLMRVDAMTDRQDLILARINDLERRILTLDTRTPAPTPGLADDRIRMLESDFAEFQWTVATLTREIEALRLKVEGAIPPNPAASTSMPTIPMEPDVSAIERTEEVTAASFPPPPPDDGRTPPLHSSPSPTATTVTAAQAIQIAAIPSPDAVTAADVEPVAQSEGETVNVTMGDPATEMDVCPSITQVGAQSEAGDGNAASESGPGDVVAAADDRREGNSGMSQIADMDVADSS